MSLLEVKNLSVEFSVDGHWLPAVSDVSFELNKGEILALVGESGCGKSVTCMSLTRLLPEPPARYSSGEITFQDPKGPISLFSLSNRQLRQVRGGKVAYIFQEPSVSLNPVFRVGDQIAEAIFLHRPEIRDVKNTVIDLLRQVGIPDPESRINCYPHEMSGGMQQRIMIAMALASNPELLIADEPTTALDVTIQAQILDLLTEIRKQTEMSIILVTHNLGIVADMADRVIVMYAGHMVESAEVTKLLENPYHPYTKALLKAVPKLGYSTEKLTTITGMVPNPLDYPEGCRFYGRCDLCNSLSQEEQQRCAGKIPEWKELRPEHWVRCWKA